MNVRFLFCGSAYTAEEMREANADDADLCAWLDRAAPGDAFGGGAGAECRCVAADPKPAMTTMEIARSHAVELCAALVLLNGRADAVASLLLQQLIAQAVAIDDALSALDLAQQEDTRAARPAPAMPARPPARDLDLGDWKLPTARIN